MAHSKKPKTFNLIETKAIRKARRQQRPRSIATFTERPCKKVILNFLGKNFSFFVRPGYRVTRDKYLKLMSTKVNAIQLQNNRIIFSRMDGKLAHQLASVSYPELKLKYIEAANKVLKKEVTTGASAITDKKAILSLMLITQSCYVRASSAGRRALVKVNSNNNLKIHQEFESDHAPHVGTA